jgi:hypothetical protein
MYVYLAVAMLSAALSGVGAWKVQNWRYAAIEKDRIEAAAEKAKFDRRAVDVAAAGHEKDKAAIRTVTKTVTREVERIVREPFYVDAPACLDADGLRQLQAALGAAHPASQPAPAVPESDGPR